MKNGLATVPFDTKRSVTRAAKIRGGTKKRSIGPGGVSYLLNNRLALVEIIRKGLPYESIEGISDRLNLPVRTVLRIVNMPQTTYNKKKRENSLLDPKNSELIALIDELIDYGTEVFNDEKDKFQRWMKKPNISIGGVPPESMLDTVTGIEEVKNCLNRIEYGNFA